MPNVKTEAGINDQENLAPRQIGDKTFSQWALGLFFIGAGVMHFVFPKAYMGIMPPWLGWHAELVLLSGIAECAGGVGVLWRPARRYAGWGLLALCIAVLPANVQMLIDALKRDAQSWLIALLVLRLPLQLLLMQWIWRAAYLSRNTKSTTDRQTGPLRQ